MDIVDNVLYLTARHPVSYQRPKMITGMDKGGK